jgi:hypothetical protein
MKVTMEIFVKRGFYKKISPEDSGEKYVDGLVSTGK